MSLGNRVKMLGGITKRWEIVICQLASMHQITYKNHAPQGRCCSKDKPVTPVHVGLLY